MDVHPPHQPIHSWRDFFIHLLTITIGLLIAIGLEAVVEVGYHNKLVKQARTDIRTEMQANHLKMAGDLSAVRDDEKRIAENIKVLLTLRSSKATGKDTQLVYSFSWDPLGDSAWKAAASSGAVAHMDFEVLRDLSDVYLVQDLVGRNIAKIAFDHQLAPAPVLLGDDPAKSSKEEIQLALVRSSDLRMELKTLEQVLLQLNQAYVHELAKLPA